VIFIGGNYDEGPILELNSSGEDVERLQILLVMLKGLEYDEIDGVFGPKTHAAVESFQEGVGVDADGIVGPMTWRALPADPDTPELSVGSSGDVVTALQEGLARYGASTHPGEADGEFGANTEAAVIEYQRERGLTADGIVGVHTWWVPAGAAGATLASLSGLTTE
jgi:peptidoglycan hydrolase-like protein with peptidoglycan-binding domain